MNIPSSITEIQSLIDDEIQESLHLDYKDSRALAKNKKDECVKDVTAFANADGGMIIYGVQEENHLPKKLDDGVNNDVINREWVDQILSTNITPPIEGITINQISLSNERSVYVIYVPKSYRGPHQAVDKKYYKRFNFRSCPMDHYEIFDIANRRSHVPSLVSVDVEIVRFMVKLVVENRGNIPAHNLYFTLPVDFEWPDKGELPRAIQNGIKYFPPGKKFSYFYESAFQIFDDNKDIQKEFNITVSYYNPELGETVTEEFYINLDDYYGTATESDDIDQLVKAIKDGFKTIKDSISNLGRRK